MNNEINAIFASSALAIGPNDGGSKTDRLDVWLQFLGETGRILVTTADAREAIERSADLAVMHFDGCEIDVAGLDILPRFGVRRGSIGGAAHVTPLAAFGRSLGVLRVASHRPGGLDGRETAVADDLATRLALALWTADVIARERRLARTLQRALLPEQLPQTERFRHSAAYLPATDEANVGGDWYDVFDLPDGRVAFSIGDVAGHGLRAAIVMGEVRQALRAAAVNPEAPSAILERANRVINLRPDGLMVTALFGILDRNSGVLTYAVAGHPAPILVLPGGWAVGLPSGGVALGVADSVQTRNWTFTISPGSLLVLYTDGLIEYSRDVIEGERRLLEILSFPDLPAQPNPAQAVVESVFSGKRNTDDAALLAVSAAEADDAEFVCVFSAVPIGVPVMRHALGRYAERQGLNAEERFALLTAVSEAAANAVEHAYADTSGIVHVRAARDENKLVVTVHDEGRWKPNPVRDERGRGLRIMRALMDRVEIRRSHSDTTLQLSIALQ